MKKSWGKMLREMVRNASRVLSMNQRNLLYIYPNNRRQDFPLADNKLITKEKLQPLGVRMPETYRSYDNFYELSSIEDDLAELSSFVIKPAKGKGGGGIIAVSHYEDGVWISVSGKRYTLGDLKKHIADIIFGVYSFDLHDTAIIEERITQHPDVEAMSPFGLADIRLIVLHGVQAMAMLRIPTRMSDGKANLHQGALGVGIDIGSGTTTTGILKRRTVASHPDTQKPFAGFKVPFWSRLLEMVRLPARVLPLGYLGYDIALSPQEPVLLEINIRPGLEIQNVNDRGLRQILQNIEGRGVGLW